ncbi:MAG TPA: GNAT family N-acetyltransferase [Candidatus Acidoferrum sp.]|nr:GNAT family N-acetyltransferase [Candidatus Acidoferrum sp.]
MEFRFAGEGDAGAIARVINLAFRVERFFVERDRTSAEEVRARLKSGKFLLAEEAGQLAGCVYLELRGDRMYFGLLAVDPARQKKGLGRTLIAAVENLGREAGCRFVDIRVVNLRAELPPIYRRLGYVVTGTAPFTAGIKTKVPCHFIDMSKPLG